MDTIKPKRKYKSSSWKPKKADYEYVEAAIARGVTQGWLQIHFGVNPNTWTKRKADYPELDAAIIRGKQSDREEIQNKIRQIAMLDTHRSQLPALIFYGKTITGMGSENETKKEEVTVTLPKGVVFTTKPE